MKFEFELRRQIELYLDSLYAEGNKIGARIAQAMLYAFLDWYLED